MTDPMDKTEQPEQWAKELGQQLGVPFCSRNHAALTIQRVFEERMQKLREALAKSHLFACCFLAFMGRDRNTERQETMLDDMCREASELDDALRAALKETPHAPE